MFPSGPTQKLGIFGRATLGRSGVQKMEDFLESDPEVGVKIIISPKAKGRR
jgi:hypothetical protein